MGVPGQSLSSLRKHRSRLSIWLLLVVVGQVTVAVVVAALVECWLHLRMH
jgi:hypothetical protein